MHSQFRQMLSASLKFKVTGCIYFSSVFFIFLILIIVIYLNKFIFQQQLGSFDESSREGYLKNIETENISSFLITSSV